MRARVNLTVEEDLVREARDYDMNLSRIAEEALRRAVKLERNRRWNEENRTALEAYAQEVREHGCILDDYRMF